MTMPEAGPTRPSWRQLAGIVVIFAGIGPLAGLLVFGSSLSVRSLIAGNGPDSFYLVPFFIIYGLMFAHLVGGPVAVATGVAVAAIAAWKGRVPWWAASAIGVGAGLLPAYFRLGRGLQSLGQGDYFLPELLATHVGATLVCWWLSMRWAGLLR